MKSFHKIIPGMRYQRAAKFLVDILVGRTDRDIQLGWKCIHGGEHIRKRAISYKKGSHASAVAALKKITKIGV